MDPTQAIRPVTLKYREKLLNNNKPDKLAFKPRLVVKAHARELSVPITTSSTDGIERREN